MHSKHFKLEWQHLCFRIFLLWRWSDIFPIKIYCFGLFLVLAWKVLSLRLPFTPWLSRTASLTAHHPGQRKFCTAPKEIYSVGEKYHHFCKEVLLISSNKTTFYISNEFSVVVANSIFRPGTNQGLAFLQAYSIQFFFGCENSLLNLWLKRYLQT